MQRLWADGRVRLGAAFIIGALVAALALLFAPRPAAKFAASDRAAVETVVRDYLLAHPEIIPEAINRLQEREVTKLLDNNRAEIETPFAGAWAGAKDGDVVLVEFFDYACPYCKAMHHELEALIQDDPKLKVVYRDLPVLGAASDEAAMVSLSAAKQGRYNGFRDKLLSTSGRLTHERIVATVRAAGLNEVQTARDLNAQALKAEVRKNLELARALGVTGTPTYVIGNRILSGAVGRAELEKAIAEARARKS